MLRLNPVGEVRMAAYPTSMAAEGLRARVRTPGKYIVASIAAALLVIVGATSLVGTLGKSEVTPAKKGAASLAGDADRIALPEFLVDLAPDSSGRIAYIRLSASIVLPEKSTVADVERVTAAIPAMQERIAFLLRGLTPEDFSGEAGMTRVKGEILRRVNLILAPEEARDVLIRDIVIQ
jgi:flagellar FliL protein